MNFLAELKRRNVICKAAAGLERRNVIRMTGRQCELSFIARLERTNPINAPEKLS